MKLHDCPFCKCHEPDYSYLPWWFRNSMPMPTKIYLNGLIYKKKKNYDFDTLFDDNIFAFVEQLWAEENCIEECEVSE